MRKCLDCICFCSVAQSCLTLRSHVRQHTRLPCPSLSPRVCSNLGPLSQRCHPTISSSVIPFSFCPQSLPASVFSNELALCIRWPHYWNLNISPSNEYSMNTYPMSPSQWIPLGWTGAATKSGNWHQKDCFFQSQKKQINDIWRVNSRIIDIMNT